MDPVYTERKALKDYIDWIKEERRRLSDEYWNAVERLRELDDVDRKEQPIDLNEKLFDTINTLSKMIPSVPVEKVVSELKTDLSVPTTKNEIVSYTDIDDQRQRDKKRSGTVRKSRINYDMLTNEIINFMDEKGIPVNLSTITKHLVSKGLTLSNPTIMMNKAMEVNHKIQRISKGVYQLIK